MHISIYLCVMYDVKSESHKKFSKCQNLLRVSFSKNRAIKMHQDFTRRKRETLRETRLY